jgi:hypothetical protein
VAEEPEFKVGDKWLYAPRERRHKPQWLTITSVGRKWVSFTMTQQRLDQTKNGEARYRLVDREYSSGGRVWRTEEEYQEAKQLNALRTSFYQKMSSFNSCQELTKQQITDAANILGIELPEPFNL